MALLISHRGNTRGINNERENSPEYVEETLGKGYHVVVDVWMIGNHFAIGSHFAQHVVPLHFLQNPRILARTNSVRVLSILMESNVHCFLNKEDSMTNGGFIWRGHATLDVTPRCVLYMPEWILGDIDKVHETICTGICSNNIEGVAESSPFRAKAGKKDHGIRKDAAEIAKNVCEIGIDAAAIAKDIGEISRNPPSVKKIVDAVDRGKEIARDVEEIAEDAKDIIGRLRPRI